MLQVMLVAVKRRQCAFLLGLQPTLPGAQFVLIAKYYSTVVSHVTLCGRAYMSVQCLLKLVLHLRRSPDFGVLLPRCAGDTVHCVECFWIG